MQELDEHVTYRPMTGDEEWNYQYGNRAIFHPTIKDLLVAFGFISLILWAIWAIRHDHTHNADVEKRAFALVLALKQNPSGPHFRLKLRAGSR